MTSLVRAALEKRNATYPTVFFTASYRYDPPLHPKPVSGLKSEVLASACQIAGITVADCKSDDRRHAVCRRRWHVMSILRAWGWSTPAIGKMLNRHHSTVIIGVRKFERAA
jgi:hypothetical protein